MTESSEYGGRPGILQSPEGDVTPNGVKAPGHNYEDDPSEAAMVLRRAGLKEKAGKGKPGGAGGASGEPFVPYDEAQAAADYVNGQNT